MTDLIPPHFPQASHLFRIRAHVEGDSRFLALLAGGSILHGGFDDWSDLDLVLVVRDDAYDMVMATRREFAAGCGDLLSAFTGEHVGEPRLLICLFGPDVIHVDLKFVTGDALDAMVERPVVIWSRDPQINERVTNADVSWPDMPPDWFEERIWTWLHYGATKLARGELFEAIALLDMIREKVLAPMIHTAEGRPQRGLRRLEQHVSPLTQKLAATLAAHDREDVRRALLASMELYTQLRPEDLIHSPAEAAVRAFLKTHCP